MKAKLLFILFLTLTLTSCTSKKVEPLPSYGLLWKITGNGLEKPSYLFGTYHGRGGMQILDSINGIDSVFNSTDQLLCETSIKNYNLRMPESNYKSNMSEGPFKPWPVYDSTYENILSISQKKILDSVMLSNKMLTYIKPLNRRPLELINFIQYTHSDLYKKSTIKVTKDNKPNDTTSTILDLYIEKRAIKRNMNIVSLDLKEELQIAEDFLYNNLSQISYKAEANLLMYYIENLTSIDSTYKTLTSKVLSTYLNQDICSFMSQDKNQENEILLRNNPIFKLIDNDLLDKYKKLKIDERNKNWMKRIPNLMAEKSCFIAVGAGHLAGEKGLINQLRSLGYEVNSFQEIKK